MTHRRQKIARWGEAIAADFLIGLGYEIIGHNVRTPHGEIDLIAKNEDITIFVEVKTRSTTSFGRPEDAISFRKKNHMAASAEYYCWNHGIDNWQIDAISIEGTPGQSPTINHFHNLIS